MNIQDTHAGILNTLELTVDRLRMRQKVHPYIERDIAIEKIQAAIYWLQKVQEQQARESLGAK